MASVYILYSKSIDKYYTGSCLILQERIKEHQTKKYSDSYTCKANDWQLFYRIDNLEYKQARNIERHIKTMKSKKYIENLKRFEDISAKLKGRYFEVENHGNL